MPETAVWRQRLVSRRAWHVVLLLIALVGLVPPLFTERTAPYWQDVPIYSLVWGIPLWIALLTLWSINRYGTITLTGSTLRVGRAVVPLDTIDRQWVVMLAANDPALAAQAAALGVAAAPGRLPPGGKLLGGAYDTPLGSETIPLRLTDGTRVRVATRDRTAFVHELLAATRPRSSA